MFSKNRETLQRELHFQSVCQPASTDIITVVHNQFHHTRRFLQSLSKTSRTHKLFLWDNHSDPPTSSLLKKQPFEVLVRSEENLGFITPNNSLYQRGDSEYVVLLNNDTVLSPGWLEAMIGYLQGNSRVGVVGYQGGFLNENFVGTGVGSGETDYVCGWAMCFRRRDAGKNLFDDRLKFAYGEDSDFCLRMREKGLSCHSLSLRYVTHVGSATARKTGCRVTFESNHLYLREKWGDFKIKQSGQFQLSPQKKVDTNTTGELKHG